MLVQIGTVQIVWEHEAVLELKKSHKDTILQFDHFLTEEQYQGIFNVVRIQSLPFCIGNRLN